MISDIHAHQEIFESLIKKVNLQDDDYLIIIGDFINRGIDSYEILHYMKELGYLGICGFALKVNDDGSTLSLKEEFRGLLK